MFALNGAYEPIEYMDSTDESYASPRSILINDNIGSPSQQQQQRSLTIDDFVLKQPIGYGSSAVVHSAVHITQQKRVAIKIIDLDKFERNQIDSLRRETALMALSKHPHVLPVYGSFVHGSKLHIVTPYMAVGSCLDLIKLHYQEGFDEVTIATILKQALEGLAYLHKNGHIHRDVKAGNLLMDEDGLVMLGDFGVSSSLMETGEKGVRKTFVGTPCWMAPEVMEQANYDYKADIWSFGITATELATGQAPFAKHPPLKVLMLTLMNDPPTLDELSPQNRFSKLLKDMIASCLKKDPAERPTAEKLLSHPFFKQYKKPEWLIKNLIADIPLIENRPFKQLPAKQNRVASMDEWDFGTDVESTRNEKSSSRFLHPNPPRRHISFGSAVIKKPTHTRQAASESWTRRNTTGSAYNPSSIATVQSGVSGINFGHTALQQKVEERLVMTSIADCHPKPNVKHQHQQQSSAPPILMIEEPSDSPRTKSTRHGKQPSVHFVDEPAAGLNALMGSSSPGRTATPEGNRSPHRDTQQPSPPLNATYTPLSRRSSNVSAAGESAKVGRFTISSKGSNADYDASDSVQQSLSEAPHALSNSISPFYTTHTDDSESNSGLPYYQENSISAVYRQLHQLLRQNDSQKQLVTQLLHCMQARPLETVTQQAVNHEEPSRELSNKVEALENQLQAFQRENLLLQRENEIMRQQIEQLKNQ